jgi:ATP-dependent DNA ligase
VGLLPGVGIDPWGIMLLPPVKPMRAVAVARLPAPGAARGGWALEPKFDGWRALAFVGSDGVVLQSRGGRALHPYFPDVCGPLRRHLPPGTVLDGELVAWEAAGERTSFPLLQRRVTAGRGLAGEVREHPAHLVVFDVLQDSGVEVLGLPLARRRARLAELLAGGPAQLPLCPQTVDRDEGWVWYTQWWRVGVEGLVVKDLAGAYRPGRADWLKLKRWASTEAVIGGVTGSLMDPSGLLLGRFDGTGRLRYVGRTGPLPADQRGELGRLLPAAGWRGEPESHPWPRPLPAAWVDQFDRAEPVPYLPVEPVVVAEVSADVARDRGRWRHPVRLLRIRVDLDPSETAPFGSVA